MSMKLLKKLKNKDLKNLLLSFIISMGICFYLGNYVSYVYAINIFILIIPFILVSIDKIKRIKSRIIYFISFFISTNMIIGTQLELRSNIEFTVFTLVSILFFSVSVKYIIESLFNLNLIKTMIKKLKIRKKQISNKQLFLSLFIPALTVYLIIYPGIYGYDAAYQLYTVINNNQLTTHFSILYMLFMGKTTFILGNLFNSYLVGFSVYTFLQMTIMVAISYKICRFVRDKSDNFILTIISIILFSLNIFYLTMIVSSSQDVIFSGMFCLVFIELFEYISNKKININLGKTIIFIIELLLLMLFRNNGVYCILFVILISIFLNVNNKGKLISTLLLSIILYFLVTGPIYSFFNIRKGDSIKEMLSVPTQQLARAYTLNYNSLTEDDVFKIHYYYNGENELFRYYLVNESISDAQKSVINETNVKENMIDYITLYLKVGIKNVGNYIEAFLLNNLGLWYLNKQYYDSRMYHPYIEYKMVDAHLYNINYVEIKQKKFLPKLNEIYRWALEKNIYKYIPILNIICLPGILLLLLIVLICMIFKRKEYSLLVPISLECGLYITLFLAPVIIYRYIMPISMITPLNLYMLYSFIMEDRKRRKNNEQENE